MAELLNDILIELECPICTNYMSPPIRQCATGHSICETCQKRLPSCPLCKGPFTDSRNITLEGLAVKLKYPCINKASGCGAQLAYNEREVHELTCPHNGVKCAMDKCGWCGPVSEIKTHWAAKKVTSKIYHSNNLCHTKLKNESFYVNIVEAYENLFWFKCKIMKNRIYWAVQLMGPTTDQQDKFYYEIEIFDPDRKKKRLVLSDYSHSLHMENSQLFREGVCLSVPTEMVEPFVSAEQQLMYHMRVHLIKSADEPSGSKEADKVVRKQRDRSKGPKKDQKFKHYYVKSKTPKKDEFVLL